MEDKRDTPFATILGKPISPKAYTYLRCRRCLSQMKNGNLGNQAQIFLTSCGHLLCVACVKKSVDKEKSSKDHLLVICPKEKQLKKAQALGKLPASATQFMKPILMYIQSLAKESENLITVFKRRGEYIQILKQQLQQADELTKKLERQLQDINPLKVKKKAMNASADNTLGLDNLLNGKSPCGSICSMGSTGNRFSDKLSDRPSNTDPLTCLRKSKVENSDLTPQGRQLSLDLGISKNRGGMRTGIGRLVRTAF